MNMTLRSSERPLYFHESECDEDIYAGSTKRMGSPRSQTSSTYTITPTVDDKGFTENLKALVEFLQSSIGLKMFKTAYRENMMYKITKYNELLTRAERSVQDHLDVIHLKMPYLKKAARLKPEDDTDNWHIFESISQGYRDAKDSASQFEAILGRARDRLSEPAMGTDEIRSNDPVRTLRDDLVAALQNLKNFSSQAHIVSKTADLVSSFIKNPKLFRTKLMNFMMVGPAGTGKTSLAEAIGDVFAKAGMFVGNQLIQAGRAELVGQYEGQTVARTRNFLTSNLDNGVIFIDEAYAITPWHTGKPEGYGSEAATAMVEFMTRYPGLYCIIVAGYEKEMTRYFLPTNEGMSRRFPNKFVLTDMTADDLILVFKRQLLRIQGIKVPDGRDATLESTDYFTPQAWEYLRDIVKQANSGTVKFVEEYDDATRDAYRDVRKFAPTWPYMHKLFQNQAGSMTNLADEAVTVLMANITFEDMATLHRKMKMATAPHIRMQDNAVMRDILVQRILNTALSNSDYFLQELDQMESLM